MTSETVEQFLNQLEGVRADGTGWSARCPCRQDDDNPSLHVGEGRDGRVLVTCHRGGGCDLPQICDAMGLSVNDLFPPKVTRPDEKPKLVATYDYRDADGTLLFQKQRLAYSNGKKTFRQRKPRPDGSWEYSLGDTPKVLYRLPQVLAAATEGGMVFVVEGEKDADTLAAAGQVATTNPGGAGKWLDLHTEALVGADVWIIRDNDDPGEQHAVQVRDALEAAGIKVTLLAPPAPHKDVTDFFTAGGRLEELEFWEPPGPDPLDEFIERIREVQGKPLDDGKKIIRIRGLLDRLDPGVTQIGDPGRLVDWTEFVDEHDDNSYDWAIPGVIERQDRVIVVAAEGVGKALALDTPIPTPTGWTTMGELKVGDAVLSGEGTPCRVTFATPVQHHRDCYVVEFSDGARIVADGDHRWVTETVNEREKRRPGTVRTTIEIRDTLRSTRANRAANHAISTVALELPEVDLPVSPYTLGAWLGDGSTVDGAICSEDPEILARIALDGFEVRHRPSTTNMYGVLGLKAALRTAGVLGAKHIPSVYLRAGFKQRLALLQGLMDTDGTVDRKNSCEFSVSHERLARDVHELLHTLGIKATWRQAPARLYDKDCGTRYRLSFRTDLPVFELERKAVRLTGLPTRRAMLRYITAVTPTASVPVRCIQVDSGDHTFLCGEQMIRTHNTMLSRQVAITSAYGVHPFTYEPMPAIKTLTIDLENPERIIRRMSSRIVRNAARMTRTSPAGAHLLIRPAGMDLLNPADRIVLEEAIERTEPSLLCLGPLYKSFVDSGAKTSEALAVEIAKYLDYLRTTYRFALWIEHHAPLGGSGGRELRPFGSAVWSRWPEFGWTLEPDLTAEEAHVYKWGRFRNDREPRHRPTKVRRGKVFPFEVIEFFKVD